MIELLGKMPRRLALSGKYSRDFFNAKGELKYIRNLQMWSLDNVLVEKYKWEKEEAQEFSSFVGLMLNYDPEKRANAAEMLKHKWLKDVIPIIDYSIENVDNKETIDLSKEEEEEDDDEEDD